MIKHCGSCKYLRTVTVEDKRKKLRYEFLCRLSNRVVDPFNGGKECTTHEFIEETYNVNT